MERNHRSFENMEKTLDELKVLSQRSLFEWSCCWGFTESLSLLEFLFSLRLSIWFPFPSFVCLFLLFLIVHHREQLVFFFFFLLIIVLLLPIKKEKKKESINNVSFMKILYYYNHWVQKLTTKQFLKALKRFYPQWVQSKTKAITFPILSLVAEHSAPSTCYVWYIHEELCKKVMNQWIRL